MDHETRVVLKSRQKAPATAGAFFMVNSQEILVWELFQGFIAAVSPGCFTSGRSCGFSRLRHPALSRPKSARTCLTGRWSILPGRKSRRALAGRILSRTAERDIRVSLPVPAGLQTAWQRSSCQEERRQGRCVAESAGRPFAPYRSNARQCSVVAGSGQG